MSLTKNFDLHQKILELSDAISRMNRQILEPGDFKEGLHTENSALIARCQELMDDVRKEKFRPQAKSKGYETEQGI